MRRAIASAVLIATAIAVSAPALATASESLTCWVETQIIRDLPRTVSVCRIEGTGQDRVYPSESGIQQTLYPDIGYDDTNTECWFRTTRATFWVIISRSGWTATIGSAQFPGGPIIIQATLPACTSYPSTNPGYDSDAWAAIASYVHQVPQPTFNPDISGITGLATFITVPVPDPFFTTLTSPVTGATLQAQASVSAVTVDWGDDTVVTFSPSEYAKLVGWPNGIGAHTYEVMTCAEPGTTERCHPTLAAYPISVSFVWTASWRTLPGAWQPLSVPPSSTTTTYDVNEIVAELTG